MPRGDPALKLAITVQSEVHAKVLRAAKRSNQSVSAWMTDAARRVLAIEEGLAEVANWEAEHGTFSEEELATARRRVHGGPKGQSKTRPRGRRR